MVRSLFFITPLMASLIGLFATPFVLAGEEKAAQASDRYLLDWQHQLAVQYARAGNGDLAIALLRQLLSKSRHPQLLFDAVAIFAWENRCDEAMALYSSLPRKRRVPEYVLLEMAHCARKASDPNTAMGHFERILENKPTHAKALPAYIDLSFDADRLDHSTRFFRLLAKRQKLTADDLNRVQDEFQRIKAVRLAHSGKFEESLRLLADLGENSTARKKALFDSIVILSWAKKHQKAVEAFERLPADWSPPDYLLRSVAHSLLECKDAKRARQIHLALLAQNPQDEQAISDVVRTYLQEQDYQAAEEFARSTCTRDNGLEDRLSDVLVRIKHQRAISLARRGKHRRGYRLLMQALRESKDDPNILCDSVALLAWASQHTEAIRQSRKLPKDYSPPSYCLRELAVSYSWADKTDEAKRIYRRLLSRDPKNHKTLEGLLWLLTRLGWIGADMEPFEEFFADDLDLLARVRPHLVRKKIDQARLFAKKGQWARAAQLLGTLPEIFARQPTVRSERIRYLSRAGRHREAVELHASANLRQTSPADSLILARSYTKLGQCASAVSHFAHAPQLTREALEVASAIIGCLVAENGPQAARRWVEQQVAENNSARNALLADLQLQIGRLAEVEAIVAKQLDKNRADRWLINLQARLLIRRGEYERAMSLLSNRLDRSDRRRFYDHYPLDVDSSLAMAERLLRHKEIHLALRLMKRARERAPDDERVRLLQARALATRGDFAAAYRGLDDLGSASTAVFEAKLRLLLQMGAANLAAELLSASKQVVDPTLAEQVWFGQADSLLHSGAPESALRLLRQKMHRISPASWRIILGALHQVGDLSTLVERFEELDRQHVALGSQSLVAVAAAHYALDQPDRALQLLRRVEKEEPDKLARNGVDTFQLRLQQVRCLTELARYDEADRILDELEKNTAPLRYQRGIRQKNWRREKLSIERGWWLISQDRLAEAQQHFIRLKKQAPFNTRIRSSLAQVYRFRGWSRKSLEEFQMAMAIDPSDGKTVGHCELQSELGEGEVVRRCAQRLKKKYPQDVQVQRFLRRLALEDLRQLSFDTHLSYERSFAEDGLLRLRLAQPLQAHRYLFAEAIWNRAVAEDDVTNILRGRLGLDWRWSGDLWLFAALSLDADSSRFGASAGFAFALSDHLTLSFSYDLASLSLPPKAITSGVTGRAAVFQAAVRQSESLEAELEFQHLQLSDENHNLAANLSISTALFNSGRWKSRLIANGEIMFNTAESDLYWCPTHLYAGELVWEIDHLWFRHPGYSFRDRISIGIGAQAEGGYRLTEIWQVGYAQFHRLSDRSEISIEGSLLKRAYDGVDTYGWVLSTAMSTRF